MTNDIAVSETQNFLTLVGELARDPNVDAAKYASLLESHRTLRKEHAEELFNQAFQRLRGKLPIIKKGDIVEYPVNRNDPNGPKKEAFKFAKWEKVQEIIGDLIAEEGFDLTFDSVVHPNGTSTIAVLHHAGGHTRRTSTPPLPCDSSGGKNNLQGFGSAMSYGQRYATKYALNLRFEDDDDGVRGGMVFINAEQVKIINDLIAETKTDVDRFLRTMNLAAVENLTMELYPVARNMLSAKKAKGA